MKKTSYGGRKGVLLKMHEQLFDEQSVPEAELVVEFELGQWVCCLQRNEEGKVTSCLRRLGSNCMNLHCRR